MNNKTLLERIEWLKADREDGEGRQDERMNDVLDEMIAEIEALETRVEMLVKTDLESHAKDIS